MAEIKFSLWNAEWMNEFFKDNPPVFKADTDLGYMTREKVGDRIRDVAGVINEVDSDIWVIVEGPNQKDELQLFFDDKVNGDWQCAVQPSGAQSVGFAIRTDTGKFDANPFSWHDIMSDPEAKALKSATDPFTMDTDNDGVEELHKFERRPIYATVNTADGKQFRVVGLHLKSKGVFGAFEWSRWWAKADGNRKKIVAQCFQLRRLFIDEYLANDATKDIPLIVCGDINDGPGFDTSEMKIQASGVERLMGSIWNSEFCLGNAIYDTLSDKDKKALKFDKIYTATFKDPIFNGMYRYSWIDQILYSRRQGEWINNARIYHEMDDGQKIYQKYPKASDHHPLRCIIETTIIPA